MEQANAIRTDVKLSLFSSLFKFSLADLDIFKMTKTNTIKFSTNITPIGKITPMKNG